MSTWRRAIRGPWPALGLGLGAWLLWDATTYSLYPADFFKGTEFGCYTVVERWLGILEPSWIRSGQFVLALLLLLPSIAALGAQILRAWKVFKSLSD